MSNLRKFVDIGINLTDAQFRGIYHGKQKHFDDLEDVIERARQEGVTKMLVTGSTLSDSLEAVSLCMTRSQPGKIDLYSTAGIHPCHVAEYDKKYHGDLTPLSKLIKTSLSNPNCPIKAFGEIGLDYDRLHYSPADIQRKYFDSQLLLACELGLPLFLHSRAAADDFEAIVSPYIQSGKLPKGVVHSFTGTADEMNRLLKLGFYIGVNGCSLKSVENLEVIKKLPLDRLMLETDGPWCEIKPTHASYEYIKSSQLPYPSVKKEKKNSPDTLVKGRCEPCSISLVAKVLSSIKQIPELEVIEAAYKNSMDMFNL